MPWIQLTLRTDKNHHQAVEDTLLEVGALSVTFRDAEDQPMLEPLPGETPLWDQIIITGLFDADVDTAELQQQVAQQLNFDGEIKIEALEDKDWVRAWMDDYKPMRFGERLWVCPNHLNPPDPNAVNLMLDPGLAFGTGTHPTTALCLQWLDSQDVRDQQVLDFGCGSGVLGIAALLLGAAHCDATDIDPQALQATDDNAQANGVADRISSFLPAQIPEAEYDLLLANILAGPLVELAPTLAGHSKRGGHIVLSGILASQSDAIMQAYAPWFELDAPVIQDDWVRISGRKK